MSTPRLPRKRPAGKKAAGRTGRSDHPDGLDVQHKKFRNEQLTDDSRAERIRSLISRLTAHLPTNASSKDDLFTLLLMTANRWVDRYYPAAESFVIYVNNPFGHGDDGRPGEPVVVRVPVRKDERGRP